MRQLLVIGIGMGDPEHLTVQATKALARLDVVFLFDKGAEKAELEALRREICERYIGSSRYRVVAIEDRPRDASIADYARRVEEWHERRLLAFERCLASELADDGVGGFLVWGDPSLYDSTLRLLERARERARVAFECEVIPGLSSPQLLAARHKLTQNRIGGSVLVTTGRRLPADARHAWDDIVVMLDDGSALEQIEDSGIEIYYGAYLGLPGERLIRGPLAERKEQIARERRAARSERGWIMDTYLLRRHSRADS